MVVNDGQNQRSRVFKVEVPAADFPAGAVADVCPTTAVVKGYLSTGPMLLAHGRAVHAELKRLGYRAMRYERRTAGGESRWHTVKL